MEIKLQRAVWRIELPEKLVAAAGFSEGESLKCQAFPGGLSLLSQDVSAACTAKILSRAEKNFVPGAEAFLLWLFSLFAGRRVFAPEKRKSERAAGSAGL